MYPDLGNNVVPQYYAHKRMDYQILPSVAELGSVTPEAIEDGNDPTRVELVAGCSQCLLLI
jgi:hypothetical protein